ncbi:MAG: hypothetical protein A2075_22760 [Geobacteraceae bacterium GWC2_58_44]|nr:MAG: hypothetical protein A2075_22760 [Geobacteraceae bacterium GWC2_58_44]HBG04164.1 hypothetical protein [Geobacter sp.]
MLKKIILLVSCLSFMVAASVYAGTDAARVSGDFRISGAGNGLVFPDGSMQYKAAVQGPAGPQGIPGPVGPQGPKGDAGSAGQVTLASICAAISAGGMELPAFCTTPSKFSKEYLSGRTLYAVWFGEGEAPNGNALHEVPVVVKIVFGSNGIAQATGLLNSGSGSFPYAVTASGLLYDGTDSTEGNTVVSGSTAQYIKTYYTVNGVFDNVDLYFFEQAPAMAYASTLTASIPR